MWMQDGVTSEVESAPVGFHFLMKLEWEGGGPEVEREVDDQILQSLFKL